jgi:hypothetical protein
MIIHSVAPLSHLVETPEYPELTVKSFSGGYFEGRNTPEGFVLSRLHSTDPALYLKKNYAPNSIIFRKD